MIHQIDDAASHRHPWQSRTDDGAFAFTLARLSLAYLDTHTDLVSPVAGWYGDRMAASIINTELPYIFSTSASGFVLRPASLKGAIRCVYPYDANSMGQGGGGCAWGSYGANQLDTMMKISRGNKWRWECACDWCGQTPWDRSGCRYNEIVINGYQWMERLPQLIEAVFFPTHEAIKHREGDQAQARRIHADLLRSYSLEGTRQVPLLSFDVRKAESGHAPFETLEPL